jgi:NADH dehydrogenase
MNRFVRRAFIGIAAGAAASVALAFSLRQPQWSIVLGIALGAAYAITLRPVRDAYVDGLMAAGALGVPLWALISVVAFPLLSGQIPEWSAEQMRAHFPELAGWIVYGASLGLFTQALNDIAAHALGSEKEAVSEEPRTTQRIVILGGGFAGMRIAACLEDQLSEDRSVSIMLVSETNALLFTPMLAEVAGSSLEPSHISTPLRNSLHRAEFIRGRAVDVDLERRLVITDEAAGSSRREIPYDHLVLALGSVSNHMGMANIEKLAFNFKSLLDAIRIRNHIIEMFERADREPDPLRRRPLLTFVIAGGGFAGVELAGAINDFAHGIMADYPALHPGELSTVLVHSRDRILPELSETLARYARQRMEARGVTFRLNARLTDARPGVVVLSDGSIQTETLIWTAGTAPNPLVKSLPLEKNNRGAVIVDSTMAAPNHAGVWALGDCAAVNDAKTGKPCPPTAQFALRQAEVLARNICAWLAGRPMQAFHFDSLGQLCVVGHQTACAELTIPFSAGRSMRFSGLFAWLIWRGVYLSKLPGLERKIRVLIDWTIELFFPRDIVQTIDLP